MTTVTIYMGEAVEGVATFDAVGLKRAGPPWLDEIQSFTALRQWAKKHKRRLCVQGTDGRKEWIDPRGSVRRGGGGDPEQ